MWDNSIARAQLVSLGLTTFLYGIFFALFVITTVVMTYNITERVRRQRKMILPISFAMLLVATVHLVVVTIRGAYGFVDQKGGSTMAFYEDLSNPTHLVNMFCLCLQSAMGDCVMIWRMYLVYGKRIIAVVPGAILIFAYTVVACITVGIMANARPGIDIFHVAPSWLTAYFSLTMATNVICTGAIAWRLLISGRVLENAKIVWPIVFVIVESCALYTLGVVIALTTFVNSTNAQYPAADAIVPLVGIAFSLIILQVRFQVRAYDSTGDPSDHRLWNDSVVVTSPVFNEDPEGLRLSRSIRGAALEASNQSPTVVHPGDVNDKS